MDRPRPVKCACGTLFLARDGGQQCPKCHRGEARICEGCGARFTPALGAIQSEVCRVCAGLTCRFCGFAAVEGGCCAAPACREKADAERRPAAPAVEPAAPAVVRFGGRTG